MERTDEQIINELGGPTELAKLFGISQPSVSGWKETGIPMARKQSLWLMYPDRLPLDWAPPGVREKKDKPSA